MVSLKPSSALYAEVTARATGPGVVQARELRDGVAWLAVEFPGYGTVILEATEFDEV